MPGRNIPTRFLTPELPPRVEAVPIRHRETLALIRLARTLDELLSRQGRSLAEGRIRRDAFLDGLRSLWTHLAALGIACDELAGLESSLPAA